MFDVFRIFLEVRPFFFTVEHFYDYGSPPKTDFCAQRVPFFFFFCIDEHRHCQKKTMVLYKKKEFFFARVNMPLVTHSYNTKGLAKTLHWRVTSLPSYTDIK